ncbi:hypothetical protein, partial [Streptococcus acidominimus]|uniref:hypothetical protein n=1 Tax=Streptococcus acidominimus TaxID=1326 RepID=UPI001F56C20C
FFYILDYLAITAKPVFNIPRYWALTACIKGLLMMSELDVTRKTIYTRRKSKSDVVNSSC